MLEHGDSLAFQELFHLPGLFSIGSRPNSWAFGQSVVPTTGWGFTLLCGRTWVVLCSGPDPDLRPRFFSFTSSVPVFRFVVISLVAQLLGWWYVNQWDTLSIVHLSALQSRTRVHLRFESFVLSFVCLCAVYALYSPISRLPKCRLAEPVLCAPVTTPIHRLSPDPVTKQSGRRNSDAYASLLSLSSACLRGHSGGVYVEWCIRSIRHVGVRDGLVSGQVAVRYGSSVLFWLRLEPRDFRQCDSQVRDW